MTAPTFPLKAVLIANRGEIAVRVARAARDLGIRSIAVYSDPDRGALHTEVADEAHLLPGNTSAETYMNIPALLDIARRAGADCVHPGYGFLSENADFAREVQRAGLTWIGPDPDVIEQLGDKVAARRVAIEAGAPLAPGTSDPIEHWEEARDFADEHGLPIAIKAAFGGGGRGLKVVTERKDIESAFNSAGREAVEAFGRGECYVEKFLTKPRHVEAQVLADTHGHTIVVSTRDCSTQRRFQKLIEEAPAPFLSEEQERDIVEGARQICSKAGYVGAGTVEFIVSEDGTASFLEVNTRVQVEHPVSEVISGVDIVAEQFRVAAGLELSITEDPTLSGHAFEFRINAEDAANGFVPSPGTVTRFEPPTGPGIRVDAGVRSGGQIPGFYDSLLGKLIVWGPTRPIALRRAAQALKEFRIEGVRTVLPFHLDMVASPELSGATLGVYTDWVDKEYNPDFNGIDPSRIESIYDERTTLIVEIDGSMHTLGVPSRFLSSGRSVTPPSRKTNLSTSTGNEVRAPFTGTLVEWSVTEGENVSEGQVIATAEAMKMEAPIKAPAAGSVRLDIEAGDQFQQGDVIGSIS